MLPIGDSAQSASPTSPAPTTLTIARPTPLESRAAVRSREPQQQRRDAQVNRPRARSADVQRQWIAAGVDAQGPALHAQRGGRPSPAHGQSFARGGTVSACDREVRAVARRQSRPRRAQSPCALSADSSLALRMDSHSPAARKPARQRSRKCTIGRFAHLQIAPDEHEAYESHKQPHGMLDARVSFARGARAMFVPACDRQVRAVSRTCEIAANAHDASDSHQQARRMLDAELSPARTLRAHTGYSTALHRPDPRAA